MSFLMEWAKGTGPKAAAASLVLLQIEDYKRMEGELAEERAIVNRVWAALGVTTYEGANGKTIDQLVAEQKRQLSDGAKWIPVEERLPEGSGVLCLVALDFEDGEPETIPRVADFHHGKFDVYDLELAGQTVTHWMPFTIQMPKTGHRGVKAHADGFRAAMEALK